MSRFFEIVVFICTILAISVDNSRKLCKNFSIHLLDVCRRILCRNRTSLNHVLLRASWYSYSCMTTHTDVLFDIVVVNSCFELCSLKLTRFQLIYVTIAITLHKLNIENYRLQPWSKLIHFPLGVESPDSKTIDSLCFVLRTIVIISWVP